LSISALSASSLASPSALSLSASSNYLVEIRIWTCFLMSINSFENFTFPLNSRLMRSYNYEISSRCFSLSFSRLR
jgi:hypothetical protein